jgi:hypothetical protein
MIYSILIARNIDEIITTINVPTNIIVKSIKSFDKITDGYKKKPTKPTTNIITPQNNNTNEWLID